MSSNLQRLLSLVIVIAGISGGLAFAQEQPQDANPAGCENASDMDSFADFIKPGWQAEAKKLIITSDLQPFRYIVNRRPLQEEIGEAAWRAKVEQVGALIRKERDEPYYVPLIVNGDITEFGHTDERKAAHAFLRTLAPRTGGPLVLAGLGNHDYANNVDDCANNKCARDSVCDHLARTLAIPGAKRNVTFGGRGNSEFGGTMGSLGYSVDIGDMHIVQLNLDPTYTRVFSYWIMPGENIRQYVRVTSSLDWLVQDLRQARNDKKKIIINMHQLQLSDKSHLERFEKILADYNVAAVFVGHIHNSLGANKSGYLGRTPVFNSGGLMAGTYLRVTNLPDEMRVETVAADGYMQQTSRVKFLTRSVRFYAGLNLADFICEMPLGRDEVHTLDDQNCAEQASQKAVKSLSVKGGRDLKFCLLDKGMANERCFSSAAVDNYNVNNVAAASPPAGVQIYGHGSATFVVAKLATMKADSGLLLELFKNKNFAGEKCARGIGVNEILEFDGDTDPCMGASSANVYGLRNGQRSVPLCFTDINTHERACYTVAAAANAFDRLYRISDFDGSPPSQIRKDSVGSKLSGKVAKVSFIAAKGAEVHLFSAPNFNTIMKVLKLENGESAVTLIGSMKVLNYPGNNLPICLGARGPSTAPLHVCFYGTFKGSFQVPNFWEKENIVLPTGMHVTQGQHHPEGYGLARIGWGDNVRVGLYAQGAEKPICSFLLAKNEMGTRPSICDNKAATKLEVSNYDGYFAVYPLPLHQGGGRPNWYVREEKGDLVVPDLSAAPDSPGVYSTENGGVIEPGSFFMAVPPSTVAVELNDSSGTLCKFALAPGGEASTERCSTHEALLPNKGLRVANFNGANPLCFETKRGSLCFSGDYEGAFQLYSLYVPAGLPPGVTAKLTGVMVPPLTDVSYGK